MTDFKKIPYRVTIDTKLFEKLLQEGNEIKVRVTKGVPQGYIMYDCRTVDYGQLIEVVMYPPRDPEGNRVTWPDEELITVEFERIE